MKKSLKKRLNFAEINEKSLNPYIEYKTKTKDIKKKPQKAIKNKKKEKTKHQNLDDRINISINDEEYTNSIDIENSIFINQKAFKENNNIQNKCFKRLLQICLYSIIIIKILFVFSYKYNNKNISNTGVLFKENINNHSLIIVNTNASDIKLENNTLDNGTISNDTIAIYKNETNQNETIKNENTNNYVIKDTNIINNETLKGTNITNNEIVKNINITHNEKNINITNNETIKGQNITNDEINNKSKISDIINIPEYKPDYVTNEKIYWKNKSELNFTKINEEIYSYINITPSFKNREELYKRENPKVSLIIPVYNQERFVKKIYGCIEKQSLKDKSRF